MRIVFHHILRASATARAYLGNSAGHRVTSTASLRTAGSAILTAFVLAACGQRGPLYLPTVPPLPPSPTAHSAAAAPGSPNSAADTANYSTATPTTAASDATGNSSTTGNTDSGSK